ncbi:MAG: GWxTD domain-containing protein, partial [Candidatus Aminicenantes bacterium]|nr:GWxTD domain-containing protein [Candidatus Aminicenantes bacterium]
MKRLLTVLLIVAALAAGPSLGSPQNRPLSPKHKAWLEDEVAVIISPAERDVFKRLETDADRDALIEEFWRQRDPTPGTARNEFRDEHYRRLAFADKTFGRGLPFQGGKTDRGRIYIALGPP